MVPGCEGASEAETGLSCGGDSSARLSDPDMMKMARTKVAPVSRNNSSTNFDRLPADVFLFDG